MLATSIAQSRKNETDPASKIPDNTKNTPKPVGIGFVWNVNNTLKSPGMLFTFPHDSISIFQNEDSAHLDLTRQRESKINHPV